MNGQIGIIENLLKNTMNTQGNWEKWLTSKETKKMSNIDIMLDELLNKLGKTKEDLVMSLNNLQQYVESQEHGDLKYISLQRMFFLKEDFENHIEDVKTHADYLGYDISDDEAKEIVRAFELENDSNIDENTQLDYVIWQFVKRRNKKWSIN